MAIVYTFPQIAGSDLVASDLLLLSKMNAIGRPTKSLTLKDLADFITSSGTGTGTTNAVVKWVDGPSGLLGDSPINIVDGGAGLKQAILTDGYKMVVDRDATTTVGDPEFAVTQNGVQKTSFGWDDDGGGFGFIYNWAGNGFKIGSTALYPQFEILSNAPDFKNISFADFQLAPTGVGPSVGSFNLDFKGVDDTGAELVGGRIFTLDSTINPSGQDLYFQTADDNGVLQTGLFIDAFQQVAIAKNTATVQLDVGGNGNFDTTLAVGTTLTVGADVTFSSYGAGTQTGTATFNLEVDANGNVIETASTVGINTIINGLVNNLGSAGSGGYDFMEWVSNVTSSTQIPVMKIPRALTLRSLSYAWMGDTALSIGVGEQVRFTIGTIPSGSNPVIANYTSVLSLFDLTNADDGTYANGVVAGLSQIFNSGDMIGVVGQETGTVTPNSGELSITFEFEIN